MSAALTITGGMLQAIGLGLVFVELAVIRSHEFGVPTPWSRMSASLRRLLRRPQHVSATVSLSYETAGSVHPRVRPGPVTGDAPLEEQVTWLRQYVEHLDGDVERLYGAIDRKAEAVLDAVKVGNQRIRDDMEKREADRRAALRPSLARQAVGGVCVLAGTVLATIGGL